MLGTHASAISYASLMLIDGVLLLAALRIMSNSSVKANVQKRMLFIALACGAILGRWALAPIPNVQPVTILMIMAGSLLGWRRGVGMAFLVAIITNMQLGAGLWTIFQALGWAVAAILGHKFSSKLIGEDGYLRVKPMSIAGVVMAFVFDWIVSLSILPTVSDLGLFVNYLLIGIPYDLLHALGNITFALWLVPSLNLLLKKSEWPQQTSDEISSTNLVV